MDHHRTGAETFAAAPGRGRPGPQRIDVHHHHAPPSFVAEIVARNTGQQALIDWTPSASVADMDRAGVATAITSISHPGVWFGDNPAARRLARACNEFAARMVADFPGRFGMFAVLPLPDIDGSLHEIAHAFDVLRADGVGLLTSYGDKWLGHAAFAPVMDELNRRGAVVYIHPTTPWCCRNLIAEVPDHLIEFATDTTRAIASLLLTGTVARCPSIRFIFSHAGGTMPFLVERMIWWAGIRPDLVAQMPEGPIRALQRFHYDTAFSANRWALSCLLSLVAPSQVLFGSDFPFRTAEEHVRGLAGCGLSPADLQAIDAGNALRLLPQFAALPGRTDPPPSR